MSDHRATPPPGLPELRDRLGTYETFLARLLALAPTIQLPDGPFAGTRPLEAMDLSPAAGFSRAYLECWATVCDVLAFYQERLLNEGFLRTAIEGSSVRLLLSSLDYAPRPAVSADVLLAFTVVDPPRRTDQVIAAGTPAQSVPDGGALPQTYETAADLRARAAWNSLAAFTPPVPPPPYVPVPPPPSPARPAEHAVLDGSNLTLKRGDRLLVRSGLDPAAWFLAQLDGVDPLPKQKATRVTWSVEAASPAAVGRIRQPQVHALRATVGLYGDGAADWSAMTLTQRLAAGATPRGGAWRASAGVGAIPWAAQAPEDDWRPVQSQLPQQLLFLAAQEVPGRAARLFAGSLSGLSVSDDGGRTWSAAGVGIGNKPAMCLAADPALGLFIGSTLGTVLRSTDGARTWQRASGGSVQLKEVASTSMRPPPRAPATPPAQPTQPAQPAGTPSYRAQITRLPNSAVRGLAVVPAFVPTAGESVEATTVATLWAGTDAGVYVTDDLGATWRPQSGNLPKPPPGGTTSDTQTASVSVEALCVVPRSADLGVRVFAGTSGGLYFCDAPLLGSDVTWSPAEPAGLQVAALHLTKDGLLLAGTRSGVWLFRPDQSAKGECVLAGQVVSAFASAQVVPPDVDRALHVERVFAATDKGLFHSDESDRDAWLEIDVPHSGAITAVAADGVGDALVCAGPLDGVVERDWPDFHLPAPRHDSGTIDLDRVVTAAQPFGWTVLLPGAPAPPTSTAGSRPPRPAEGSPVAANIYYVQEVSTAAPMRFGLQGGVTRLVVTGDGPAIAALPTFDLRATLALTASQPLSLSRLTLPASPAAVGQASDGAAGTLTIDVTNVALGAHLDLVPAAAGLPPGRVLVVTGSPVRLLVGAAWFPVASATAAGADLSVRYVTPLGDLVQLTIAAQDAVFAATSGTTAAESVVVASVETFADRVRVNLVPPGLSGVYDAASLAVLANVAQASQGQSQPASGATTGEVLGSGDQSLRFQQFTPKFQPVSFVRDPATGEVGAALAVRVDGVPWSQTAALPLASATARVYALRSQGGTTSIQTGDGRHGARVPTGVANVTALYRSGAGTGGNVPAGSITTNLSTSPGVTAVTNPLPAQGGVDAETLAQARWAAPVRARPLDRVVSIDDIVDLSRSYPGIGKASLFEVATPRGPVRVLTIASDAGAPVPVGSPLFGLVTRALASSSSPDADVLRAVTIETYRPRTFAVSATLQLAQGADAKATLGAAGAAVRAAFAFARRTFGQPVRAAEVVRALQEVRDVVAVRLTRLTFTDELGVDVPAALAADPPLWSEAGLRPAQLLLLDGAEESLALRQGDL